MQKILNDKKFLWILTLGVALYFQMSLVPGFFQDGYLYAAFGKNAAELGHWLVPHLTEVSYSRFYHQTSFVFILEGLFFKVFGSSFTAARIFAGLFSLASGPYLFRFLKDHKKDSLAYLSLIIFFLIPPLVKKSRFPNVDLPLMLSILVSLCSCYRAFIKSSWRNWLKCGVLFGPFALLKGSMALLIPLIILVHIISRKSLKTILDLKHGRVFFSGFLSLSLILSGNIDIFHSWINFTFFRTILESRGSGSRLS